MATEPSTIQIGDLLPAVLGIFGVYLLLPKPGSSWRALGWVCGLVSLGIAGWQLGRTSGHMPLVETILFWCFAGLALIGAVQLVSQPNPARGAVSFALVVLNVCGIFLMHGAPFLAAGAVIIYAGAIVVTFLFVIMLCQQHGTTNADGRTREPLLSCGAGAVLLGVILALLRGHYDAGPLEHLWATVHEAAPTVQQIDSAVARIDSNSPRFESLSKSWQSIRSRATARDAILPIAELTQFRFEVDQLRSHWGDIVPPDTVVFSEFSGPPANRIHDRRLPAANVAALGHSLFTDYLLAVEMAGTLLLVATIGTIAIAQRGGRRSE